MQIISGHYTNVGPIKKINQDSLSIKVVNSPKGMIAMAIVCDGMGGLEQGELASKEAIVAFNNWFATDFAKMVAENDLSYEQLVLQWRDLIDETGIRIQAYADEQNMMMGTTISGLLICEGCYYIFHVGDSRIYQIGTGIYQLTKDHTLVAKEQEVGRITKEQAKVDPRRNVLLQCVGASDIIEPQFEFGELSDDTLFLICSDGLVHEVSDEELFAIFSPKTIVDKASAMQACEEGSKLVLARGEKDNISVICLRVFE